MKKNSQIIVFLMNLIKKIKKNEIKLFFIFNKKTREIFEIFK